MKRGLTKTFARHISEVFGIPQKNIEVGYSMINKHGLVTHIVHYVYESDLSVMDEEIRSDNKGNLSHRISAAFFVKQLYSTFEKEINNVFRR